MMSWRRRRDENGIFLVLWAVFVIALLTMVAIVLDLGALRSDRRKSRAAADAAATAGILSITEGAVAACNAAWKFALLNLEIGSASSPCATMPPCDPATPQTFLAGPTTVGPYVITIAYPVVGDPDGAPFLAAPAVGPDIAQAEDAAVDGPPCERLGVRIELDREAMFAKVIDVTSNRTSAHSVARLGPGSEGEPAALLVLDPTGCEALTTAGQGFIRVEDTVASDGTEKPGIIALDSNGLALGNPVPGCANANSYVVNPANNVNNYIIAEPTPGGAPGLIRSFALAGAGSAKAYDSADTAAGRLSPVPTAGSPRITRAPVDHRFNCKAANGCTGTPAPHIDTLVAALGGPGVPAGYRTYPDEVIAPTNPAETAQPHAACSMPSSAASVTVPAGNWYLNCPAGFSVSNITEFTGGSIVTPAGISVGAQGRLTLNAAGAGGGPAATLFMRSGDLSKGAQGWLLMHSLTVYKVGGRIDFAAGTGVLTWTAPLAGNFEDLAYWTESTTQQTMGGQANLALEGVLFMPNAQFRFSGQPGINQTQAQFIAHRVEVLGQGGLQMRPDPDRVVLLPIYGSRLIR